jgi:hypothetical protein
VDEKTRHIQDRFPDKKHRIDLLMAQDPEFLTLCEDHDDCVDAMRYWTQSKAPEAETKVNEYRDLVQELEKEVTEALEAMMPRRLD